MSEMREAIEPPRKHFGDILRKKYESIDASDTHKMKEEKIDGQIYLMAPPASKHRDVQYNIAKIFNDHFMQKKRRCRARFEDRLNGLYGDYFEPDVKVLCHKNGDMPLIVIEVLSPSTRVRDLGVKMEKYAQLGIGEYWIADWEDLTLDVYLLNEDGRYSLYESYIYNGDTAQEFSPESLPELNVKLEDVFYYVAWGNWE